jgi:hypothetical protein
VIDADERLGKPYVANAITGKKAFNLIDYLNFEMVMGRAANGYALAVADMWQGGPTRIEYLPRIFGVRADDTYYEGRIHNRFIAEGRWEIIHNDLTRIEHFGYEDDEKIRKRWKRTSQMLYDEINSLKGLEFSPHNELVYNNQVYLISIHHACGHYWEAIEVWHDLLDIMPMAMMQQNSFHWQIVGKVAQSYLKMNLFRHALDVTLKGLALVPCDMDLLYMAGVVSGVMGRKADCVTYLERYLVEANRADIHAVFGCSNSLWLKDRVPQFVADIKAGKDVSLPYYG